MLTVNRRSANLSATLGALSVYLLLSASASFADGTGTGAGDPSAAATPADSVSAPASASATTTDSVSAAAPASASTTDSVSAVAPTSATTTDSVSAAAPASASTSDSVSTAGSATAAPASAQGAKVGTPVRLHAEVTDRRSPELAKCLADLDSSAIDKMNRAELLEKEKQYKKGLARIVASGKDVAELCTAYRGFEQSSEAADIILGEKHKLKSAAAVKYVKQKQIDEVHNRVITAMMQIASGLDSNDEHGKELINEGRDELANLIDKEHADSAVEQLRSWCQAQKISFPAPLNGPMQINAECKDVLGRAIQGDPVVKDIQTSLHKYNGRSKFARTTAKVVNTSLSIAALSPTIISPASQLAWTAYIMTQGGPEESKLLKEVYLAKRFEDRFKMLNDETALAVNSYNSSVLSKNTSLLAFSQFMIGQLCEPPAPAKDAATQAADGSDATKKLSEKLSPMQFLKAHNNKTARSKKPATVTQVPSTTDSSSL